jgi:hypothetical protein
MRKTNAIAYAGLTAGALLTLAACDATRPAAPLPIQAARPATSLTVQQAPSRRWSDLSDSALWAAINERDSVVAIGLKTPGSSARGVARGRPTLSRADWRGGITKLQHDRGLSIARIDSTHLPVIEGRILSVDGLSRIRRLPFVDFVEPARMRVTYFDGCDDISGGSSNGSSESSSGAGGTPVVTVTSPSGLVDYIAASLISMNLDKAWQLSTGAGVTVGVTDTGLDTDNPSEWSPAYASSGDSYGRSVASVAVKIPWSVVCAHGTKISGLVGAPRDGRNIVGAAYRANIVSVYQADGENPDVTLAANAIHAAATGVPGVYAPAKVIVMAWGEWNWYDNVANEIDTHYYNDDVIFVGASGTCFLGLSYCPRMETAVFPAEKEEVLAVSGANADGTRPGDMYDFGTKSGVLAYTDLASTGLGTTNLQNISGSSASTGIMGGIAALVRSRYPSMTNRDVMNRLMATAGVWCAGNNAPAWRDAVVNAYAALGGVCIQGSPIGPSQVIFYPGSRADSVITYAVHVSQGIGPISIRWMTGETTSSIQIHVHPLDAGPLPIQVYADIQDLGTSNPPIRKNMAVHVINNTGSGSGGGTCRPPMLHC